MADSAHLWGHLGHSPQFGPKLGHKKDKNELSVTIPTFVSCESIYHRASNSASGLEISIHQGGQNLKNVRFVLDIL